MDVTGWTRLPNEVIAALPEIGHSTFAVYCVLAAHADPRTGRCWPAQETIAAEAHVSVATVRRALRECEARGWVETSKRHKGNCYTLGARVDSRPLLRQLAAGSHRSPVSGDPVSPLTGDRSHRSPVSGDKRTRTKNKNQKGPPAKPGGATLFEFCELLLTKELGRKPSLREIETEMTRRNRA